MGCSNHGCFINTPNGMGTNSMCHCLDPLKNEDRLAVMRKLTTLLKYEKLLFELGEMEKPPCFRCGYNGEGYYQPDKHPCAELHHRYRKR